MLLQYKDTTQVVQKVAVVDILENPEVTQDGQDQLEAVGLELVNPVLLRLVVVT